MKTIKKLTKVLFAFAVLAFTLSFLPSSANTVSAATKKSVTMFKGEKLSVYTIGGSIKSVKSSKKKVCSVKKKGSDAIFTAKKAGKATITIKTTRGSLVYTVTVKKNPFKVTYSGIANGNVMVTVQNKSKTGFDSINVSLTYCDSTGSPVTEKTAYVNYVGPKQKAYTQSYVYDNSIDLSKTVVNVSSWSRNLDYTYSNYSKKVNHKIIKDGDYYKLRASTNYKGSGFIYVDYDIAFLDAAGNIVRVDNQSVSLYSSKKVDTSYGSKMPEGATSYKILSKRVMLKTYN
ncbi:MAG: hypothetical protein K5656_01280 [Lachnospiraceae bacterium]|nr:hypothetical protein [Lachnospiraceae bacterium]